MDRGQGAARTAGRRLDRKLAGRATAGSAAGEYKEKQLIIAVHACIRATRGRSLKGERQRQGSWLRVQAGGAWPPPQWRRSFNRSLTAALHLLLQRSAAFQARQLRAEPLLHIAAVGKLAGMGAAVVVLLIVLLVRVLRLCLSLRHFLTSGSLRLLRSSSGGRGVGRAVLLLLCAASRLKAAVQLLVSGHSVAGAAATQQRGQLVERHVAAPVPSGRRMAGSLLRLCMGGVGVAVRI